MVLSVPVIALGATLGTATSILALCGVTCLCRHMHPKKGLLQRDRDPDPEKARPGVLRPAQQVSGAASPPRSEGEGGAGDRRGSSLSDRAWRGAGTADVLQDPPRGPESWGGRLRAREERGRLGLRGSRWDNGNGDRARN